ncbi:MAG: glycosyltransferase [Clostridia bacterium]
MNVPNRESFLTKKSSVKDKIERLVMQGSLEEARVAIKKYEELVPNDAEIYSIKAVMYMLEDRVQEAEKTLFDGLELDSTDFDILYNLGYLYEQRDDIKMAARYYIMAQPSAVSNAQRDELDKALERIGGLDVINKASGKKIVFFFKKGMNSFADEIIANLSKQYIVQKVTVDELSKIDKWMEWTDAAWFDWCDDLAVYGSRLGIAREKKIICRLHSYEAFTHYIQNINWANIDRVIFVAEHIRDFVLEQVKSLNRDKTEVIPNGINLDRYTYKKRKPGFNIAYVGYINYKKGPMLLLHTFKEIHDRDPRYKLHIAGKFQDSRYVLYFRQMVKEWGLENSIVFDGWQDDMNKWLEDKNYVISTSVLESQHLSIMEAMAKGIKPIIHNFVGAKQVYEKKYVWSTIGQAVNMVVSEDYCSEDYRWFVNDRYSFDKQMAGINKLIEAIIGSNKSI